MQTPPRSSARTVGASPVTRRRFLHQSLALTCAAPVVPGLLRSAAGRDPADRCAATLVLIELAGGNDGLGTVIPFEDPLYHRARPTLRRAATELDPFTTGLAFPPELSAFTELYREGQLMVLSSVGYPEPDRSHFRSTDIWHTASLQPEAATGGWIGRWNETAARDAAGAYALGLREVPLLLRGEHRVAPSIEDLESFRLDPGPDARADERLAALARLCAAGTARGELRHVRELAREAQRQVESFQRRVARYRSPVEYPATGLAAGLRLAAQCITGAAPARVYYLRQPGYDTHAEQAPLHRQLLGELGEALRAFQQDLHHHDLGRSVAVVVSSEFGRRVKENASRGTDHGAAAPVFVLSEALRGGLLGSPPRLDELDAGDVPFEIDFRRLYATLLEDWLGFASEPILGRRFETLPLFTRAV